MGVCRLVLIATALLCLLARAQDDEFDADLVSDIEDVDSTEKPSTVVEKSEYDDDEFERPLQQPGAKPKQKEKTQTTPKAPHTTKPETQQSRDVWSLLQLYWMESTFIVFLLFFTANFFIGRAKNLKIATAWITAFAPLFRDNFAKVGGEAVFTKQGANIFTTTATGRINCLGAEVTIELKKRHDLISVITEYFFPTQDLVTIDVAMEPSMAMIVFAIISRSDDRHVRSQNAHKDIYAFAPKERNGAGLSRDWPTRDLAVYTDSVELVPELLPENFAKVIAQNSKYISVIHFTDQSLIGPAFAKTLRFVFKVPDSEDMKELSELMELVPAYIDLVSRVKLTQMAEKKATKVRQDFMNAAKKDKKEDIQEERDKRMEAKRLKEKEAFEKLSQEEQKRELVKRKKRDEKKKMKGGKMKIVFA